MDAASAAGSPAHGANLAPSAWVRRFVGLVRPGGAVLDLAAGHGRHARLLAAAGLAVTAIDRDAAALASLRAIAGVEALEADLEAGQWPLAGRCFDAIVVTNYLWRALLPRLGASLAEGGVAIYETFAAGNEIHGKPSNPDFLLRAGELLDWARSAGLEVVAYEHGSVTAPRAAVVQRICARLAQPGTPGAALGSS